MSLRFVLLTFISLVFCGFAESFSVAADVAQAQNPAAIMTGPCAVFVAPTPAQIDSLKIKLGPDSFYTCADHNMASIAKARTFLDGKKVLIVNKDAGGTVEFKKENGKVATQNLSGMTWGIILFNGKSDPLVIRMSDIEKEYNRYMK